MVLSNHRISLFILPYRVGGRAHCFKQAESRLSTERTSPQPTNRGDCPGDKCILRLSVCPVCLSLFLSHEPSHECRKVGPPDEQTLYTLHSPCSRRGSAAGRSATLHPALAKKCPLQKRAAFSPAGPASFNSVWAASSPTHATTWCLRRPVFRTSLEDQRLNGRSVSLRFLNLSQNLQPPLDSTHFRCNVLHAGIVR